VCRNPRALSTPFLARRPLRASGRGGVGNDRARCCAPSRWTRRAATHSSRKLSSRSGGRGLGEDPVAEPDVARKLDDAIIVGHAEPLAGRWAVTAMQWSRKSSPRQCTSAPMPSRSSALLARSRAGPRVLELIPGHRDQQHRVHSRGRPRLTAGGGSASPVLRGRRGQQTWAEVPPSAGSATRPAGSA